jgi:hypothetical protein
MTEDQILHRLLVQFVMLKEEHSVMRVVLKSLIQSHPDPASLLSRFDELAKLREAADLAQPIDDQTLERRQGVIAEWRQYMHGGSF